MDGMTIGKVAKQAGVNIETLRYYERRGLVQKPLRTRANYRMYPFDTVRRVRFIKRAQALGFSLSEIDELLSLRATPDSECAEVKKRAEAKVGDIDAKLKALHLMQSALTNLIAECGGTGPADACPILAALDTEDAMENTQ